MTAFDLVAEIFGEGSAAPAPCGAGRPQPSPSAPTPIPPEQIAAYAASWLLRLATRPDLHAPGPALRVAAVLAHREVAGQTPLSGRELTVHLPPKVADAGLRSLRIAGLVRSEVHPVDSRKVAYRPAGGHKPAKGALADVRRLNWLRRAAVDAVLGDVAVRLALLAGASWPWEDPAPLPEGRGLAGRLGCTVDEIAAAWAALAARGLIRFNREGDRGLDGDGRLLVRVTHPRASNPAEGEA